ncbi:hypothetical protein ACVFI8_14020 [Agarivorans sp. MS3-6]
MNQQLVDSNRAKFSGLVTFCIVLLVVLLLFVSLIRTMDQAEQQIIDEYSQTWGKQLAQVHGLWLARFRPRHLTVNLYQRDANSTENIALAPFTLAMSKAGWPQVATTQQCLALWHKLMGMPFKFEGKNSYADYKQAKCFYTVEQLAVFIYDPEYGSITKEWL